jgi:CubicO group peptidase (beta-lactamase class C family)
MDDILIAPAAFAAGFQVEEPLALGRPAAFGHAGWGGSLGFADPEAGVGFGYVTNLMLGSDDAPDPRPKAPSDAVYESL